MRNNEIKHIDITIIIILLFIQILKVIYRYNNKYNFFYTNNEITNNKIKHIDITINIILFYTNNEVIYRYENKYYSY